MADLNVCPLLTAVSDAPNSISISPNTASGADKVINSLNDSTMVKGELRLERKQWSQRKL